MNVPTLPIRRFVVMTNEMTPDQQLAFIGKINDNGIAWSRYTSGGWLLVTNRPDVSVQLIHLWLVEINQELEHVTFEISGVVTWHGRITADRVNHAQNWMTQFWG